MSDNKWDTIAGVEVGLGTDQVLCANVDTGEKQVPRIPGHKVYVRKCKRPEEVDGILIPEKSQHDTVFALVLAVGSDCGKFRKLNKTTRKMLDMRSSVVLGMKPHDMVLCPDDHPWAITRSPWRDDDFFIDECALRAVIPGEE